MITTNKRNLVLTVAYAILVAVLILSGSINYAAIVSALAVVFLKGEGKVIFYIKAAFLSIAFILMLWIFSARFI